MTNADIPAPRACPICGGKVYAFRVGTYGLLKCSGLDPRGVGCGLSMQRAEGLEYAVALFNGEIKING